MSHRDLNPDQFRFFRANPKEMGGQPVHTLEVWHPEHAHTPWAQAEPTERDRYAGLSDVDPGHRPIGSVSWHAKTGEIRGIYVRPEHQRKGIATTLYGKAKEISQQTRGVKPPRHSPDRTPAGDAWARSVGGRLPRKRQPTVSDAERHFRDMGVEIR